MLLGTMLLSSLTMSLLAMISLKSNSIINLEIPIIMFSSSLFKISIIIDWMSSLFGFIVTLIASTILLYSTSYIPTKEYSRFSILLSLFVLSMILLTFSNNIFFLLLGWDGLGITSFILVIYYQNYKSNESGILTILSNRVGDIAILLSISSLMSLGSWNMNLTKFFPLLSLLLLLIASMSKSALIPFSAWLPAAMAAPTPISALVHSSTLVTAGIFLLIRMSHPFHPTIMKITMFISVATLLLSGISANWEQDLKKIIALSTLSQMAMMAFAISINAYKAAFFHLITHALFKSTMFLCAGMIIHLSSYQDTRLQTSSVFPSFQSSTIFGISSMALFGLPFLSGFYSKDSILESIHTSNFNSIMTSLMLISLGMTACYSIRLSLLSSKTPNKMSPDSFPHSPFPMNLSISFLCPFSIFLGFSLSWTLPMFNLLITPLSMKMSFLLFTLMGILISTSLSFNKKWFSNLGKFSISIWFLNFISTTHLTKLSSTGYISFLFDNTWSENTSVNNPFNLSLFMSKNTSLLYFSISLTIMIALISMLLYSN